MAARARLPNSIEGGLHLWTGLSWLNLGYQGVARVPGAPSGGWDPTTLRWTVMPSPPSAIRAVWTGSTVIVIGGTKLDPATFDDVFSAYRFVPPS